MDRKIRLIVCDIDGTLIRKGHEMTAKTKAVLKRLHGHGIMLGIASGRPLDEVQWSIGKWELSGLFDLLIGMNGAELLHSKSGEESHYFLLKREWMKEIIQLMKPFEHNCIIYRDGALLCSKEDEEIRGSSERSEKPFHVVTEEELCARENAKLMFRIKQEDMKRAEAYLAQHPSPFYKGFKTQPTLLEFADRRVSKAVALMKFCEEQHLPLQEVMAFGDTSNDNEMLEVSGWGVCLRNGSDDTKQVADAVTKRACDEDGLAWYLEEHILQPQGW